MSETTADIVKVLFQADGVQSIARAFESVDQIMGRAERSMSKNAASGVRERVKSANQERKERESTYAQMFKDIDAKEKGAAKSADAAARSKAKSEASSARSRLRVEEDLARSKQRILDNSANYAGRMAERQASAEIRAAERVSRTRERLAKADARESAARNGRIGGSGGSMVSGAVSRVLGGAGMLVGSALAIGGGVGFADSIRGALGAEKSAVGLINSLPGKQGAGMTVDSIISRGKAIQAGTNIDKGAAIEAMRKYSAITGDSGLINDSGAMMDIAKLAKAGGSDLGDLMGFAGLMKAQNKNLDNKGLVDMLRAGSGQGMSGAIELKDLAAIGGRITASRGAYSTDQTSAQKQLLGMAQLVFPTAGSADMAATIVSRFSADAMKSEKIRSLGLVDKKTGTIADPAEIISRVLEDSNGDLGKIQKSTSKGGYGFMLESIRAFEQFAPGYREAYEKAGGAKNNKAARKAASAYIVDQINEVTGATMSKGDVDERFAREMATKSEKLDGAMNRLKEILADKGVPLFERFMNKLDENLPQIESGIGKLAAFVEWFADNPVKGLGALVLAKISQDLLTAGIGSAVKTLITSMLTEGSAGNVVGGALNTGGKGALSGIPGIAGATAITLGMLVATGESATEGHDAGVAASKSALEKLANTETALKGGKITKDQADESLRDVKGFLATQKDNADSAHQALDIASVPLSLVSSDARKAISQTHAADEVVKNEGAIVSAMNSLETAIREQRIANNGGGSPGSLADPAHPARNTTNSNPRVAQ